MKKKLILHSGVHKTGTTSIQSFLAMNYEKLLNKGFYVPINHFTYENKATAFRDAIMKGNSNIYVPVIEDIVKQSELNNCNTIVISDEDFHHFALKQNDNIKVLEDYFDIEICVYLRRQDKFAESVYGFSVQWYSTRFTTEPKKWLRNFPVLNYKWVMEQWESFF